MKFEKQTYTQTPNSLFVMMKDMDECELKVVLLICRYTFGYHRDEVKLSTRRIADEIGMNTASVQKGADKAVERGLIEKIIDGNKTTTWRALVGDSENESQVIQKLNRGVSENESLLGVKETIKKEKKGDLIDGMIFYGKQAQTQQVDEVEEIIVKLEKGLRVNIARSNGNQSVARRILRDGRSVDQWLTWVIQDDWRATHTYLYADLEKVWRDFPQAFDGEAKGYNPQGLEIGL